MTRIEPRIRRDFSSLLFSLCLLVGCAAPPASAPAAGGVPQRIISVTPSLTELLFELGVGKRVVGVTRNDDYPAEVKQLPTVGDMNLDYEAIVKLKPDLVVLDPGLNGGQLKRLQELGLRVGAVQIEDLKALPGAITRLGELVGQKERAARLSGEATRFFESHASRPRRRVFIAIADQPLMTAGGGTYVDQLLELAGGLNVYHDHPGSYEAVSMEKLLELQPEVIVAGLKSDQGLARLPGWSSLRAVRNHRVYELDGALLFRPSMRFEQAVQQLEPWLR